MNCSGLDKTPAHPASAEPSRPFLPLARRRLGYGVVAVFLVLSLGVSLAAWHYFEKQRRDTLEKAGRELDTIADLKVSQIADWREERRRDVALFFTPKFARYVQDVLLDTTQPAQGLRLGILCTMQQEGQFESIQLFDAQSRLRCSWPATPAPADPVTQQVLREALQTNQIVFSQLHREATSGEVYLDLATPLILQTNQAAPLAALQCSQTAGSTVVGAVLFRINARTHLFPAIRTWPTPSRTAETLIVRREGEEVLYLNDVRYATNAAFVMRRPVAEKQLVAARAARGERGLLRGRDYRGVPVLAAVRAVPGRRWLLIAKVDEGEMLAPLRNSVRVFGGLLALLLLAAVLGVSLIWRDREYRFSVQQLKAHKRIGEALRQNAQRLQSFTAATFEGILISEQGRIVEVNDQLLRLLGRQRFELLGQSVESLVTADRRPAVAEALRCGREKEYESRLLRAGGGVLEVEIRGRASLWEGRAVRIAAIRDVTQHKRQQHELERLNRLYRLLGKVNDAIVRARSRQELFAQICCAAVDCGGFALTWIGWLEGATRCLKPVASSGDETGYLNPSGIVLDEQPPGRGGVGTVLRTGKAFIANDFLQEACLKPWHAAAQVRGFQAMGVFPLRHAGAVCGVLVVHAGETNFFQAAEIELLQEVSVDLSFALDRLEQEAERRRMEGALRQSELWLRQSQRVARVGSYVFDYRTRSWSGSEELEEILGLDARFEKGPGSWQKLVHGDDWAELLAYSREVRKQKKRFQRDYRIVRPCDGQERWISAWGQLLFDATGEAIQLQGVVQDITERKQAEEDIRASRKRLVEIIENTPAGYFFIGADGRFQHVNAAWLRLHGFGSPEQVLGQPFALTQTEADLAVAQAVVTRVLAGESVQSEEVSRKRADGTLAYHSFTARPVRGEDGIVGLEGFVIDTTRLRQAHELLREREQYYRSLIENSSDIITLLEPNGVIVFESPSIERVFGYGGDELVGRNIFDIVHPEDKPLLLDSMAQVLSGSVEVSKAIYRYRNKAGAWRMLESVGQLFNAQRDGRVRIVANSRDVTERLQLESQLRQSQKMEAIGQLVGGVAHDFNNILTAVLIHLGLLKADANVSSKLKESLGDLERETLRATSLTRQLLLFSRQKMAQVQPLDLDVVIRNLAKMLRRVLGEPIELTLQEAPGDAWVKADVGMMEQVLMNLCINARDAMAGGGRLLVGTARVQFDAPAARLDSKVRPGQFVCLTVRDTGCGMEPAVMERIFEPFFTTKGEGKGTGLGLATVYGIVQKHEGWIDVQSAPGQGTTFRLYLPAWRPAVQPGAPAAEPEEEFGGSETILFVEDDASLRPLAALWLQRLGYTVLQAGDGAEALRLWSTQRAEIALLVTDQVLPGPMRGLDIGERLRLEKPSLKVIVSSGYSPEMLRRQPAGTDRAVELLAKPYDVVALSRTVRRCLDNRV